MNQGAVGESSGSRSAGQNQALHISFLSFRGFLSLRKYKAREERRGEDEARGKVNRVATFILCLFSVQTPLRAKLKNSLKVSA